MRNFTLLLIGGLLSSGIAHGQTKAENRTLIGNRTSTDVMYQMPGSQNSQPKTTSRFAVRTGETAAAIWKPYKEYGYEYNPSLQDPWVKTMEFTLDYDKRGNETFYQSADDERTYTTYDENNMKIETISQKKENGNWVSTERKTYKYDQNVHDFVIDQNYYSWDPVNEEWNNIYSHKYDIERDSEGRVTKKTKLLLYQGEYELIDRTEIVYGEDGKAKTYTLFEVKGYEKDGTPIIKESLRLENIEWENTNGQILHTHETFYSGDNRIKKATRYDNEELDSEIEVTYTAGKIDFKEVRTYAGGEEAEINTLTTLDDNGSFRGETQGFYDMNEDKMFTEDEMVFREYTIEMYNERKNVISSEEFASSEPEPDPEATMAPVTRVEPEEGMERVGGSLMTYTYGDRGEILEQIIEEWDYVEGVYEKIMKLVSTDFRDVTTGLETTLTESGNLVYSVSKDGIIEFSMEGMNSYAIYNVNGAAIVNAQAGGNAGSESIAQLPAGLYILKVMGTKGTETVKFLKR